MLEMRRRQNGESIGLNEDLMVCYVFYMCACE